MRGICCAGHKALYSDDWGGLPDEEFLSLLDPKLAACATGFTNAPHDATTPAGMLCAEWASPSSDCPPGSSVAIGEMDVHYGAIGSGVDEGTLVKVIGTSTCDCAVVRMDKPVADIPGICGIVPGAILPGYYGVEAGQSAVGDIFKWWVEERLRGRRRHPRARLTDGGRRNAPARTVSSRWTGTTATARSSSIRCSPASSWARPCTRPARKSTGRSSRRRPSARAPSSSALREYGVPV